MPLKNQEYYAIANMTSDGTPTTLIGRYREAYVDCLHDFNDAKNNAHMWGFPGYEKHHCIVRVSTTYTKVDRNE